MKPSTFKRRKTEPSSWEAAIRRKTDLLRYGAAIRQGLAEECSYSPAEQKQILSSNRWTLKQVLNSDGIPEGSLVFVLDGNPLFGIR